MELLNIKVINANREEYYGSAIQYKDGTFEGVGEETNYHTSIILHGILKPKTLNMTIIHNEMNNSSIEIRAKKSSDSGFNNIGVSHYFGKTLDHYEDSIHIEIVNVNQFLQTTNINQEKFSDKKKLVKKFRKE